ncbi:MFS transporter [Actinoplanes sp. SE50]|uniref:MFS transporter n=1 Tax=unclassified Actinoplanes TaxID=2626549 RepID=UPI00023ED1F1|nr:MULTISPECIES: MFS transporter [unclassified Actinoplanes]AEV83317.1 putative MFS-type transporter [Actinoplanes sp. SE50/110]ATO81710.1 MFS transporter [Actinoplanes sp. SE50]SLL99118.1 MFS transporter [Actinoplanes sp. SE50/110]
MGADAAPAAYRALLDRPGFRRYAIIGLASKLAPGMAGLSLLLLIGDHYSLATAGLAVSASAVGQGVSAPVRGRLIDRFAAGPVLIGCLAAQVAATVALVATAGRTGPAVVMLTCAAIMGATGPPVAVMMRTLWRRVTDAGTLSTAMALDSSMAGAALIVGPAVAGWLSVAVSPVAPFVVITALTAGTVVLLIGVTATPSRTGSPRHRPGRVAAPPSRQPDRLGTTLPSRPGPVAAALPRRPGLLAAALPRRPGLLATPSLRRLLVANGLFVSAVTATDVVLPGYAREFHAAGLAGVYLGVLSVGSVLGSFAVGAAPALLRRGSGLRQRLGLFTAGSAALALGSWLSPAAVLLFCPLTGLMIGTLFATLRTTGGDLAPPDRVTETMSWLSTMDLTGAAAGAAVFAHIAGSAGSRTALALIPVVLLAATAISRNTPEGAPTPH